jgi:hypothetical protein
VSGGAAGVLPLMVRGRRPLGRFSAGPRCTRVDMGGHARCPHRCIDSLDFGNGSVRANISIHSRDPARACAACPPLHQTHQSQNQMDRPVKDALT